MVQGFCFALLQYSPIQAFTASFAPSMQLYRPRGKTAHGALQKLFRLFAAFFRCCVAVYPAILHHLRHAGAYHSAVAPPANTRYQRHAGCYTGQHSRPVIIRYIRAQRCAPVIDPCQTVQHIADHASPAGSRCFQRLALAWHRVGLALAWHCAFFLARRRGTIGGYRRNSFRAFAR